jgi:hypothetical protein
MSIPERSIEPPEPRWHDDDHWIDLEVDAYLEEDDNDTDNDTEEGE